ncbi:hypothetical protein ACRAWD_07270 [Caulobacter segnis]
MEWVLRPRRLATVAAFWKQLTRRRLQLDGAPAVHQQWRHLRRAGHYAAATRRRRPRSRASRSATSSSSLTSCPSRSTAWGSTPTTATSKARGVPQSTLSATDLDGRRPRHDGRHQQAAAAGACPLANANFALIYEKKKVSARLAYNWRSDFLLTVRDVIIRTPRS